MVYFSGLTGISIIICMSFLLSYAYILIIGAGKTTTFSVITGDLSMTAGSVSVAGYDIETNLRDVSVCIIVFLNLCHSIYSSIASLCILFDTPVGPATNWILSSGT